MSYQNDNKSFLYLNQLYPFNFESFVKYSHYFARNQKILENENFINLIDEMDSFLNVSQDSIISLISFCKEQEIEINNFNIINMLW